MGIMHWQAARVRKCDHALLYSCSHALLCSCDRTAWQFTPHVQHMSNTLLKAQQTRLARHCLRTLLERDVNEQLLVCVRLKVQVIILSVSLFRPQRGARLTPRVQGVLEPER